MAKVKIEFSPDLTGKVLTDFVWDWCKRLKDNVNVSTSRCSLLERGKGIYILSNPNITQDTDFRFHLISDPDEYTSGIFSLSDGDVAKQSSLEQVIGGPSAPGTIKVIGGEINKVFISESIQDNASPIVPVPPATPANSVTVEGGKINLQYRDGSQVLV